MSDLAALYNSLPHDEQRAMLNEPGLPLPPNITSNFENRPNQNGIAHAALILCIIACTLFISLATYTKLIHNKVVRMEDGFAFIAIISWCVFVGYLYEVVIRYGYFIHQWDIQLGEVGNYLEYFWIVTLAYFITMAFIKVAIVFQWIHIFVPRNTRNTLWWTLQAIGWLNWVGCIVMMFMVAFACEGYHNPLVEGSCLHALPTIYIAPSINLVFDLIALILPQRVIWGLQLSWQKRLGVSLLFALGILACVSAAIRIPTSITLTQSLDVTYNIAPTELWCLAEMSAGILIYCMPSAPAAIKRASDAATKVGKSMLQGSAGGSHGSINSKNLCALQASDHRSDPPPYREMDGISLTMTPQRALAKALRDIGGLEFESRGNGHGIRISR